jgi:hypothetical protein
MKKTLFCVAIFVTAALAGCHKSKPANNPSSGSDMGGSAMAPAGSDMGSAAAPAGGGSAM